MKRATFIVLSIFIIFSNVWGQGKRENLKMKYLAATLGLGVALAEGCEQAYFYSGEQSKWDWYTKNTSHIWFGGKRAAMIGTALAISQWHPRQKLVSVRTGVQWVGYWCLYSSVLNRGLRKVQTGKWFDWEGQHGFYIDVGWFRFEVDMDRKAEAVLLGTGLLLMVVDCVWDKI